MAERVPVTVHAEDPLLPGDLVRIVWKIFQGGAWLINYQSVQIRDAFANDGRVNYVRHSYDNDAMTFGVEFEILGGSTTVAQLADITLAACWDIAYPATRQHQVLRAPAPEPLVPLVDVTVPEFVGPLPEPAVIGPAPGPATNVGAGMLVALAIVAYLAFGD